MDRESEALSSHFYFQRHVCTCTCCSNCSTSSSRFTSLVCFFLDGHVRFGVPFCLLSLLFSLAVRSTCPVRGNSWHLNNKVNSNFSCQQSALCCPNVQLCTSEGGFEPPECPGTGWSGTQSNTLRQHQQNVSESMSSKHKLANAIIMMWL